MRFIYTLLAAVSVVATISMVSGYGTTQTYHAGTNTTTDTPSSPKQTVWIEYARYTAYQEHQGPTYWVVTNKPVAHVGQFLGAIDDPSTQSGWHSNGLSVVVGTKFYAIPGVSPAKAFAVQTKDGMYMEAVLVGTQKPR